MQSVLNLPKYKLNIKVGKQPKVFDPIRKKYLILQPEEWVRQNFTQFLIQDKGVPIGLINNEITLRINGLNKRCDSVIFTTQGNPLVLIEYKAPNIAIEQKTFNQISRYNIVLKVPFLIVSNGLLHYFCKVDYNLKQTLFINRIPNYDEMILLNK